MVLRHMLHPNPGQRLDQALAARRTVRPPQEETQAPTKKKLRPIHMCMDFDGTLTKRDTMAALAGVCYKEHARKGKHDFPPWSHFVDAYMKHFQEHEKQYRPKKHDRRTIDEELYWLNSLERIERASLQRVKQSGLFDLKLDDSGFVDDGKPILYEPLRSGEVQMRPGYIDLVYETFNMNPEKDDFSLWDTRVEVVSVNWSRVWITRALVAAAYDDSSPGDLTPAVFGYISYWAGEGTRDKTVTGPFFDETGEIPLWFVGSVSTTHSRTNMVPQPSHNRQPSKWQADNPARTNSSTPVTTNSGLSFRQQT